MRKNKEKQLEILKQKTGGILLSICAFILLIGTGDLPVPILFTAMGMMLMCSSHPILEFD